MNKNWFYRVLALALVAMLAVPMFALADDDVLAPAAEAPAEELATAIDGEEEVLPIAKRALDGIGILEVYLGYTVVEKLDSFDINVPSDRNFQINLENSDGGKETFKSSNKKVAMVSSTGFVTLTGVGTTTITCSGTVGGKKKTTKFVIEVKDKTNPKEINGHFYQAGEKDWGFDTEDYSDSGSENMLENGKKYSKDFYIGVGFEEDDVPTLIYEPVPFNADGEWIGPDCDPSDDGYTMAYVNGYLFKNSNAKVMFFDGNNHNGMKDLLAGTDFGEDYTSPVDKPYKASAKFWTGSGSVNPGLDAVGPYDHQFPSDVLAPVFYKNGTNKLTIKTMATAGLKSYTYTNTFVIPKEKVVLRRGTDKELMSRANHSEVVLYQIDTLDIQSMDKVVLTIKVYNGTDWGIPVKDVVFRASVTDKWIAANYQDLFTPFLQYGVDISDKEGAKTVRNAKVKGSVKAHKQSTITITFENHRNGDFNIKALSADPEKNNYEKSNKDALEILAPYPDVWNSMFALNIDEFRFDIDQDHWIVPIYAFGTIPFPYYGISAGE